MDRRQRPEGERITAILHVTKACNLRCTYCYASAGGAEKCSRMSIATLRQTAHFLATRPGGKSTEILFHGGEPLTMGMGWYRRALSVFDEYPRHRWTYSMQSNGTLMTPEWAEFLVSQNIHVGLSCDGPEDITDAHRGAGATRRIERAVALLRAAGATPGALAVITVDSAGRIEDIAAYFRSLGIGWHPSPCYAIGRAGTMESPDMGTVWQHLVDAWVANPCAETLAPLRRVLEPMTARGGCCNTAGDCQRSIVCVDATGDIYPCNRTAGDSRWRMGHVSQGWYARQSHPLRAAFRAREAALTQCQSECRYSTVCRGGCPSGLTPETLNSPSIECPNLKKQWACMERFLTAHPDVVAAM